MSMSEPYVSIRGMSFSRGERLIYDKMDVDFPRGKVTAIMGPSGTGKTTLLRLIGGQLLPDEGRVVVDGHSIPELSRKALFDFRRKNMSMLFQTGALFTDLSVFDNVAFPLRVHTDLPESMIRDLVLMKLEAVGLRGAHQLNPAELSGGMARRVALARAIAMDPEIIMYDEPFTGLDPISMGMIVKLIRGLNKALGLTSLLVSHDIEESCNIADYLCVVSGGKVIGFGTPDELLNEGNDEVKQFLRGDPDGPVPFHYPAPDYQQELMASIGKGR
ncbi:ATP-binding cassette domain-containing protein [Bacterioplanoides sp. SCSIO 12839]|uniref:ATP-binding cassette domain-containing protein n=1 Tax=Bacterioplanoides sp. SCSIO 12839 TaxID=2829569 RepID=UPI0021024036|nr:ATP-binding cassette domain-containing protein [Bacterioplanoides sp. SCSIO 12839]UTW48622.1 ATP-binding cassette domain-containing protein [Bacterioplanoides sp. SCSIO 12839]